MNNKKDDSNPLNYVDIDSRLQKFETPDQFADFFCKCAESQKKNQQCFGDCDKRTDQQR